MLFFSLCILVVVAVGGCGGLPPCTSGGGPVLLLLVFGAVTVVSGYEKLPDRDPNRLTSLKKTFGDVVYGWVTNADGYPTQTESIEKYGPIEDWDVSQVTKMNQVFLAESSIFKKFKTFNADLSKWDTSRVTTMVGSKWNN